MKAADLKPGMVIRRPHPAATMWLGVVTVTRTRNNFGPIISVGGRPIHPRGNGGAGLYVLELLLDQEIETMPRHGGTKPPLPETKNESPTP